ncbi:MAG TPA: hypothetical protein VFT29_15170 [Gemmatimonadaceae bacterium]|nr:hypothetical protein [Gemmatimonadaceae bacterium]
MSKVRSVRATRGERTRWLPGDGLILPSIGSLTHAITIKATAREIWPWLVQMGAGSRAGWYSYDRLDNDGVQSAERIIPELQRLEVGMIMPWLPRATEGFTVLDFAPERHLVLGWLVPGATTPRLTWTFVLEPRPGCTRLIVRGRAERGYRFFGVPRWMSKAAARTVHFFMQRKQLIGIARRAEGGASVPGAPPGSLTSAASRTRLAQGASELVDASPGRDRAPS